MALNFVDTVVLPSPVDGTNADPERLISWFDYFGGKDEPGNDYRFLSNFYTEEPFKAALRMPDYETGEILWLTSEHMFAAAKAAQADEFSAIETASTPAQAKHLGRTCNLRPDWETLKIDVMRQCLAAKFTPESSCGQLLLNTGDALLVEGTYWHDEIWGVNLQIEGTPGQNLLGCLLMARRAELRAGLL